MSLTLDIQRMDRPGGGSAERREDGLCVAQWVERLPSGAPVIGFGSGQTLGAAIAQAQSMAAFAVREAA